MHGDTSTTAVPRLHLSLLGGFVATRAGGAPVVERWRRPRAQTVLKLLALADGRRMHRDAVAAACWPDADETAARRNLRVALHAARHAVEPELPPRTNSSYVVQDGELLALHPDLVTVDVHDAVRAAQDGLRGDADALAEAAALLTRELLPEDRHAEWAAADRLRLSDLRDRVLHAVAEARLDAGRPEAAITPLLDVLEHAPADEAAHLGLMRAHLALGHRRRALAQYHRCVQALRDDFGTSPGAEIAALYARTVARQAPSVTPSPGAEPDLPDAARAPDARRGVDEVRAALTPAQHRTLNLVLAPGPRVTLLSGEAGVGKSRLAAAASDAVRADGGTVLWGSTDDAVVKSPYGPVVAALDAHVAALDAGSRTAVATEYPELVTLLPTLGPGAEAVPRSRLFPAVGAFLDDVARGVSLVVLEDLHAADVGSLHLLYHLARRPGSRWRVLATLRDDEPGSAEESRQVLDALVRHGHGRRLELMRLARTECDALVRETLGGRVADPRTLDQVWALSLGNPMFALEVARALADGTADDAGSPEADVPDVPAGVLDLVGARIDRLDETVRSVLAAVAARPGTTSLPELADVVRDGVHPAPGPAALAAALDRAADARMVETRRTVVAGRQVLGYAMAHPMTRLVCARRTGEATRRAIHAAHLATVRHHRPDALDLIAWHALGAEDPAAEEALVAAARHASRVGAHDAAAEHLRRALSLPVRRPAARQADLLLELAVEQRLLAEYTAAAATLESALDVVGADDGTTRLRAVAMLAELHARGGRPEEAAALLADHPVPDRAATGSAAETVAVAEHHLSAAVLAFMTGRYPDALASARAAGGLARQVGETGTVARSRALSNEVTALVMLGDLTAARDVGLEALAAAEASGDAEQLTRVLSSLAELSSATGYLTEAVAYAERALAAAEQVADPTSIAFERGNLARLLHLRGRTADAERLARAAVDLVRPFGATWCLRYVLLGLAQTRLDQGDPDEAAEHLREVDGLGVGGDPQVVAGACRTRAELELARGRAGAAQEILDAAGPVAGLPVLAPVRVRVLAGLGRHDEAATAGEAVLSTCVDHADRLLELRVSLALAEARCAAGDARGARRYATAARQLARAMPSPPLLARAERLTCGDRPGNGTVTASS
ncbi:ATP-binding protein [Isoptericola haloaureus]|uniref:AAA family ATPase n=1 Tax=Isoptericola haloaureus TaxID=1542902 RepID=A0ABU7Z3C2_9MICO